MTSGRSSEATRGYLKSWIVFANNFWLERDRHAVGLIAFLSSRRIVWYATWPIWVTSWPWPKVKIWPWPLEFNKYVFRRVSAGETRWCHRRFFIFLVQKLFAKKTFYAIWPSMTSGDLNIDLNEKKNTQSSFNWNLLVVSIALYVIFLGGGSF